MIGYESKRAAAQNKLIQDAFDEWWDSNRKTLSPSNPCMTDSFEYWAWEGWHAALELTSTKCEVQPAQEPDTYRSVPHGHCTHPRCKEVFSAYIEVNKRLAHYEPEGKSPMILNAAPPQRPWVGLTEEEFSAINQSCFTKLQAATSAESILKAKNT